jgi:PAS domain S-box-containing protein
MLKDKAKARRQLVEEIRVLRSKVVKLESYKDNRAKKALQRREEQFRHIFRILPYSVVLLDMEGNIQQCNDMFTELHATKGPAEAQVGRNISEFFPPEERPRLLAVIERTIKEKKTVVGPIEYTMQREDGSRFSAEGLSVLMLNETRTPKAILGVAHDITERKKAEKALRDSEQRLQAALDAAELMIWDWDLVSGQINRAGHHIRLFGYEEGQFDGRYETFEKSVHPEDLAGLRAAIEKSRNKRKEYLHEYRVIWPDGSIHWILGKGRFQYDDKGQAIRMLGVVKDITEFKQAERALSEQKEVLQTILDNIPVMTAFLDSQGRHKWVNKAWEQTLGWTLQEAQSRDVLRDFYPDDEYYRRVVEFIQTAQSTWGDFKTRRRDGEVLDTCWANVPLSDGSNIGIGLDITERKQAEQALKESEIRFRELFESMSSGVAVYEAVEDGEDFVFKDMNKAGENSGRVRRTEIIGKKVTEVFPGVEDIGLLDVFRRVWRTGKPERHPVSLYKDKRLTHWVENYVYKLPSGEIVAVYDDVTERKKTEKKLMDYHNKLKSMAVSSLLAEERERRRIAQGLHDDIGQKLAMAKFGLQSSLQKDEGNFSPEFMTKLCCEIDAMIEKVRSLTFELSNPVLTELGLEAALERHLAKEVHSKYGIEFDLVACGKLGQPDEDLTICLFRSVRELLNNIIKHASAKNIRVTLDESEGQIVITVEDDGVGFDVSQVSSGLGDSGGFGLFSVREQIESFGGCLKIKSETGRGSLFAITVPSRAKANRRKMS